MAGEFAKFYIRLGTLFDPKGLEEAKNHINQTDDSASNLKSTFTKIGGLFAGGAAIYKTIDFAKDCWNEYAKSEEAVARLNQQLRSQGIYSDSLSTQLQNLASEIQKITTVSDDDALAVMQLGLSMGISADKIGEATKQAIGLSKAYGVDLNSAIKMVALAGQGDYTMLQRYIPQLRSMTDETEKAAAVTKLLADGFTIATTEAETTSGKLKVFENRISDLKERIGKELLPVIDFWLKKLESIVGWLEEITKSEERASNAGKSLNEIRLDATNEQIKIYRANLQKIIDLQAQTSNVISNKQWLDYSTTLKNLTDTKIELEKAIAKEKAAKPAEKPAPKPPATIPAGMSEEELAEAKKQAERKLKEVDGWYLSAKGEAELSYLQFIYGEQGSWDEKTLEQKEALMIRAQEIYARDNETMAGSFLQSLDRMKSSGMGWAQAWDAMWSSTISGMSSAIETFIKSSGNMFENFKKLLSGIFKSILNSFISMVSQMIAKWLLFEALTGLGFGGMAKNFLLGTRKEGGYIPETGPYLLHKGEEVIPADVVNSIKNNPVPMPSSLIPAGAGAVIGAPNITLSQNITIGGTSETDINVIAKKLTEATRNGLLEATELAKTAYKVGKSREGEIVL